MRHWNRFARPRNRENREAKTIENYVNDWRLSPPSHTPDGASEGLPQDDGAECPLPVRERVRGEAGNSSSIAARLRSSIRVQADTRTASEGGRYQDASLSARNVQSIIKHQTSFTRKREPAIRIVPELQALRNSANHFCTLFRPKPPDSPHNCNCL